VSQVSEILNLKETAAEIAAESRKSNESIQIDLERGLNRDPPENVAIGAPVDFFVYWHDIENPIKDVIAKTKEKIADAIQVIVKSVDNWDGQLGRMLTLRIYYHVGRRGGDEHLNLHKKTHQRERSPRR
jgi:hypothetical protein